MNNGAVVDDRWSLNGLRCVVLENRFLRVVVIPDHGANTYHLISKESGIDFLFQHPRLEPRRPTFGQPSSLWIGGIDELLPTGFASTYKGQNYAALGEVWCQPWNVDVVNRGPDVVEAHLWCQTIMAPLRVDRWMSLHRDERMLRQRHRVTNVSTEPFDLLWGVQHLTVNTGPGGRIDLPAERVLMEHYAASFFDREPPSYRWPYRTGRSGEQIDMRIWPPIEAESDTGETRGRRVHYAMLRDGWMAYTRRDVAQGIGIVFPKDLFPVAWLYLVWGYRGLDTVALQPWTGYPAKLHDAAEKGICRKLNGGEVAEGEVRIVLYSGISEVSAIDRDGHVDGR